MTNRLLVEVGYSENYTGYKLDAAGYGPDRAKRRYEPVGRYLEVGFNGHEPLFHQRPDPMVRKSVDVAEHRRVPSLDVTGSHSLKMGMQWRFGYITADRENNGHMVQQYSNGVPLQVALYNLPIISRSELNGDFGLYIQDTWQLGKLTLEPRSALRTLQCGGCRADVARRPVRERAPLRPDPQPAEFHRLGAAHWRRVRFDRQRQDRPQVQRRTLHGAGCLGVPGALQPDDAGAGLGELDRSEHPASGLQGAGR